MSGYLRSKIRGSQRMTEIELQLQAERSKMSGCEGKRPFTSFDEARRNIPKAVEGKSSGKLWAYKCPACHAYHIGRTVREGRPVQGS